MRLADLGFGAFELAKRQGSRCALHEQPLGQLQDQDPRIVNTAPWTVRDETGS